MPQGSTGWQRLAALGAHIRLATWVRARGAEAASDADEATQGEGPGVWGQTFGDSRNLIARRGFAQLLAKALGRAKHTRLDGADGDPQDFGDLLVLEAVVFGQNNDFPQSLGEGVDRPAHGFAGSQRIAGR